MKKIGKAIRGYDAFGTPVTINYKGEDTHKSLTGGICTIVAILTVFIFFVSSMQRLINRENPEYASYFLPASRSASDSLSIPELRGQMYIGLKQRVQGTIPGSYKETIIPFDSEYINGKIDYFDGTKLQGRENLSNCEDQEDFNQKV